MNQPTSLTQILLKSVHYTNGKWIGELELVIQHKGCDASGWIPFMYDRTWHLQAFKYPNGLTEAERENVKKAFHEQFESFASSMKSQFFEKRDTHATKPTLSSFTLDEERSNKEIIYVQFQLNHVRETFFMTIQLVNDQWHYKLHSRQHSLDTYKTFYAWEDAVFEAVIKEIHQHPTYRLKFVVFATKFKHK